VSIHYMKRKLAVLGLFIFVVTLFVVSIRNASRRVTGTSQSLVVTQDGRVTILPQPDQYATMVVVVDKSKTSTNASSSTTNVKTK